MRLELYNRAWGWAGFPVWTWLDWLACLRCLGLAGVPVAPVLGWLACHDLACLASLRCPLPTGLRFVPWLGWLSCWLAWPWGAHHFQLGAVIYRIMDHTAPFPVEARCLDFLGEACEVDKMPCLR